MRSISLDDLEKAGLELVEVRQSLKGVTDNGLATLSSEFRFYMALPKWARPVEADDA